MYSPVDVYVAVPKEPGWAPIVSMAELLCTYLKTEPTPLNVRSSLSRATKLLSLCPRSKRGNKQALVIAYDPGQLNAIAQSSLFLKRYSDIYGWVIDSFWSERIPRIARANKVYSKIFVTDSGDLAEWQQAGVSSLGVLPWGTDVWSHFSSRLAATRTKTTDVLRVGRQPTAWDDDDKTGSVARHQGLVFEGRPGFGETAEDSVQLLHEALSRTKTVLAFSTRVSPTRYTHPTKDYITARWLDGLAWGATIVGQRPSSAATYELLWEGATVDISPTDTELGMKQIQQVLPELTQQQSALNVLNSLEKFDWRHRFKDLFEQMGVVSEELNQDIAAIHQALIHERNAL